MTIIFVVVIFCIVLLIISRLFGDGARGKGRDVYEYTHKVFGDSVVKYYFKGNTYFTYKNKEYGIDHKVHHSDNDAYLK